MLRLLRLASPPLRSSTPSRLHALRIRAPIGAYYNLSTQTSSETTSTITTATPTPLPTEKDAKAGTTPTQVKETPDTSTTELAAQFLSRSEETRPQITLLVGGPGVGKGTLASQIVKDPSFVRVGHNGNDDDKSLVIEHVSVGSLLRKAISSMSMDREMAAIMSRGGVIPSPISTYYLLCHLCDAANAHVDHWVIDGFPRSFANAMFFDSLGLKPTVVIALDAPDETLRERLRKRGRRDDLENIIENRLVQFQAEWESIKEFYRRRNMLVCVDANCNSDVAMKRYLRALQQFKHDPTPESQDKYDQHKSLLSSLGGQQDK